MTKFQLQVPRDAHLCNLEDLEKYTTMAGQKINGVHVAVRTEMHRCKICSALYFKRRGHDLEMKNKAEEIYLSIYAE